MASPLKASSARCIATGTEAGAAGDFAAGVVVFATANGNSSKTIATTQTIHR